MKNRTPEEQITAEKYADIIHLERPSPSEKHPRMDLRQRAKIFSSFDALRGYKEAVAAEGKKMTRVKKQILAEDAIEELNQKLSQLKPGMTVTVTYFKEDELCNGVPLGYYETVSGTVQMVDKIFNFIKFNDIIIKCNDIFCIKYL